MFANKRHGSDCALHIVVSSYLMKSKLFDLNTFSLTVIIFLSYPQSIKSKLDIKSCYGQNGNRPPAHSLPWFQNSRQTIEDPI